MEGFGDIGKVGIIFYFFYFFLSGFKCVKNYNLF